MLKSKKVLSSFFVLSILGTALVGCGANETADEATTGTEEVAEVAEVQEVAEVEEVAEIEEVAETEESDEVAEAMGKTEQMIRDADYISKIKLITKGQDRTEIKVLDNIKAVLSAKDLPILNLEENRVYLVFLKDDGDEIVLVNGDDSVVLLEGDNHELFEKINKEVHQ